MEWGNTIKMTSIFFCHDCLVSALRYQYILLDSDGFTASVGSRGVIPFRIWERGPNSLYIIAKELFMTHRGNFFRRSFPSSTDFENALSKPNYTTILTEPFNSGMTQTPRWPYV